MSGTQEKQRITAHESHQTLVGRSLQHGEYLVEAVVGHGGMGQVFLASHRTLDAPVAIKQGRADQPLPESVIAELDRLLHNKNAAPRSPKEGLFAHDFPLSGGTHTDRFLREALLLARLNHPAIPTLYDYFFEDGYWYLVMEYLPGPTLAAYIRQYAPLPPLEALNYAMQLCDVLDYLHQQSLPVIFRDLKPSNVILTPEGRLMLVDFGIARYFKEGQINDTTEFGSPGYAPPEQYEGSGQTDARSDLYSLGVILHEMISGQRPARGGTRGGKLESLHRINPALSPALSGLVIVATRPEPMYRFQSARAFYQALERTHTIEERRTYRRYALLAEEEKRTAGLASQVILPPAKVLAGNSKQTARTTIAALRTQRLHMREHFHEMHRERLEQEALAIQLASIDESLKQRASPAAATFPTPAPILEEAEEMRPSRSHRPRRPIQGAFIIMLLLCLVLTSVFAYTHYSSHTNPTTLSQKSIATLPPEINAQSTWQVLPSLPSAEADNTATYVQIDQRAYIYVSGGYRGSAYSPLYSRGLLRYDIAAAHWEILTSKDFPIMGNNAAALDESKRIFFTGGYSTDTQAVQSLLYIYQPGNGRLAKIVPPARVALGFGGAMLADHQGHLYMTEGFLTPGNPQVLAGTGWYRYDIASGQWHLLTPLPVGLGYVVLASDGQGGILMIGGSRDAGQSLPTSQIYRYDTLQNTWTLEQASAPVPISGAANCAGAQDHLVIVGGYDPVHNAALPQAWLVTLHTLQWEALPQLPFGGSLLGSAACDGMGHVFLERGANNPSQPTADFLELTIHA